MRLKLMIALVVGLFAIAGCSASKHPNLAQMGKVKNIEVDAVQKSRENGFLKAKVAIINTSNKNKRMNYRFQWLDDQEFPVGSEEGWKSKIVYGGQSTFVTGIAPTQDATDFRIEMQEP